MNIQDWLVIFKKFNDVKIFSVNHFKLFTGLGEHSLRISLSRLSRRGVIERICRGFYANPFNPPLIEEISGYIYQPSYVSLESALSSQGILSQIPQTLTCVTINTPHNFKTSLGIIEYRQIKKEFFWGFSEKKGFLLAEPEKALLDLMYLTPVKDRARKLSLLDLDRIDRKKIKRGAQKMGIDEPRF